MSDAVKLIECPRDAWQGLKGMIPADLKADYLKVLISAGFKHIDAVSFVSPKAVPQMADSEEVLKELDPPEDVEIIGIVVNEKGAQRAIDTKQSRPWAFLIPSRKRFFARIRTSRRKTRWRNWKRFRRKRTMPGWMWWFIFRWRLAIRTGMRGALRKCSRRSNCWKSKTCR